MLFFRLILYAESFYHHDHHVHPKEYLTAKRKYTKTRPLALWKLPLTATKRVVSKSTFVSQFRPIKNYCSLWPNSSTHSNSLNDLVKLLCKYSNTPFQWNFNCIDLKVKQQVVGVQGVVHLGQIQSGLRSAIRIVQVGENIINQSHGMFIKIFLKILLIDMINIWTVSGKSYQDPHEHRCSSPGSFRWTTLYFEHFLVKMLSPNTHLVFCRGTTTLNALFENLFKIQQICFYDLKRFSSGGWGTMDPASRGHCCSEVGAEGKISSFQPFHFNLAF